MRPAIRLDHIIYLIGQEAGPVDQEIPQSPHSALAYASLVGHCGKDSLNQCTRNSGNFLRCRLDKPGCKKRPELIKESVNVPIFRLLNCSYSWGYLPAVGETMSMIYREEPVFPDDSISIGEKYVVILGLARHSGRRESVNIERPCVKHHQR